MVQVLSTNEQHREFTRWRMEVELDHSPARELLFLLAGSWKGLEESALPSVAFPEKLARATHGCYSLFH